MSQEVPKHEWQNRGFSSPSATLETVLWAGRQEDYARLLECFAAEVRAAFGTTRFDPSSEPIRSIALAQGLEVIGQTEVSTDEVDMTYLVRGWNRDQPIIQRLRKVESCWRLSGPPRNRG